MGKQSMHNFTQEFIRNLPSAPINKRNVFYDTQQAHLLLMVSDKGQKSFYVSRTYHGQTIRFCLGRFGEIDLREARAKAGEYARAIAEGKTKREIFNEPVQPLSLNDYAVEYVSKHAKPHKLSWEYEQNNYDVHVRSQPFANSRMDKVTKDDIHKLHVALGQTRGQVIANRVLSMLGVMFECAIRDGCFMRDNPARGIRKFREQSRSRFFKGR